MVSLTLEQILQLHALVLVKDGGADGVRAVGRLEAAVSTRRGIIYNSICQGSGADARDYWRPSVR